MKTNLSDDSNLFSYGSAIVVRAYVTRIIARIQNTFELLKRCLTDEVATLLETQSRQKLDGQKRIVTMLFSDLRGFSALSEQISLEQIVQIINLYLGVMTNIIHKYKGTINNFMGDGIFVMFGAPIEIANAQEQAISCAIAMQLAMDDINKQLAAAGLPSLAMGIGIHTGAVFAGNIGSQKYAKYTVMGRNVNLAARIETYTLGGQILISAETLKSLKELVRVDAETQVQPKGIKEPITIYEIGGISGKYNLYLPQKTKTADEMITLQ
jgi:adenylate cyclase